MSVSLEILYRPQKVDTTLPRVRAALMSKRDALLLALEAKMKARVPVKTGALRRSIFSKATDTADAVAGMTATSPDVNYASFVEIGTKAHIIRAVNAKALAFQMGGKTVFATQVMHPGTTGQFFVLQTFQDMRQQIIDELEAAAQGAAAE